MLIDFHDAIRRHGFKVENVLHVGAYTAAEIGFYQPHGARHIHWVEANRGLCERLRKRLDPKLNLVTCAVVSDRDGDTVSFNITNNTQSSSILDLGEHSNLFPGIRYVDSETRTTTTIDKIMEKTNIDGRVDFLSIDIQGAELLALKGAKETLDRTDALLLEINEVEMYKGCALVGEVDDYLSDYGIHRVETGRYRDHPWGDALYIRT
jgi:FkbM family methyltransferase